MNRRITRLVCLFGLAFIYLTLSSIAAAEVLHRWFEPNPDHQFNSGHTIENLFNTYTSKDASRSESNGSWQLTGSATASASASAPLPRGGDLNMQFNAHALVRATGDLDTLEPHTGDGLAQTANGAETKKTSSDGTTTASTKRKAHVVMYQNEAFGEVKQRSLDVSTLGKRRVCC